MTRKTLTRNQILKAKDLQEAWVPVPEWSEDAEVLVTTWTARTKDRFEMAITEAQRTNTPVAARALIVALSVIDSKTKKPIFTEADVEALAEKHQSPMDRIFQKVAELNPGNFASVEEAVEDTAKNS